MEALIVIGYLNLGAVLLSAVKLGFSRFANGVDVLEGDVVFILAWPCYIPSVIVEIFKLMFK
jgi:hypothetical protein